MCRLVGGKKPCPAIAPFQTGRMFVGTVKLFWSQENPYSRVSPVRPVVSEHTPVRHDLPSTHDLAREQAEESRLARAAQISMRQLEKMDRLLEPVE